MKGNAEGRRIQYFQELNLSFSRDLTLTDGIHDDNDNSKD